MKRLLISVLVAGVHGAVFAQTISTVSTLPESPSPTDPVMASVSGDSMSTDRFIDHTVFSQSAGDLTLGLYWDTTGMGMPVVTPYTHNEDLGTFAQGEYLLTARSYYDGQLWGESSTSFTVVPEPGTVSLLILGALALVRGRRRRTIVR